MVTKTIQVSVTVWKKPKSAKLPKAAKGELIN